MIDGMWIVQYQGVVGDDAGVIVFTKGKIMRGDNAFTYLGDYATKDSTVAAHVKVHRFNPKVQSVLGIPNDDFELEINATVQGSGMKGQASLVGQAGSGIVIKLTKCADMP
jgi:T3SS negative regulator,GrlR